MLPDNIIRDLRLVADVLRAVDVYDATVVAACRRMAGELSGLAARLEDREIDPEPPSTC